MRPLKGLSDPTGFATTLVICPPEAIAELGSLVTEDVRTTRSQVEGGWHRGRVASWNWTDLQI